MTWLILAAPYLAIGLGVFAWCIRSNAASDPDQKKRSAQTLVLFPELCLFWPLALFLEIRRNKKPNRRANHLIEWGRQQGSCVRGRREALPKSRFLRTEEECYD